jgi:hypothetical protein
MDLSSPTAMICRDEALPNRDLLVACVDPAPQRDSHDRFYGDSLFVEERQQRTQAGATALLRQSLELISGMSTAQGGIAEDFSKRGPRSRAAAGSV